MSDNPCPCTQAEYENLISDRTFDQQLFEDLKAFLYSVIHANLGPYVPANYRKQAEGLYEAMKQASAQKQPPSLEDCRSLDCGCDGECERAGLGLPVTPQSGEGG